MRRTSLFLAAALGLAVSTPGALAQANPCANDLVPLRQAVDKEGLSVKNLIERKAPREQVCEQLKRFAATEAKFVKYLEDNQSWCGVPPQAVTQLKGNHDHTLKLRGQACAAGPMGAQRQGPPPGPGLSEALGTSKLPTSSTAKTGRGTYDTLTGNPFQR